MKATIEESKFGFYVSLEAETLQEAATITRLGLNREYSRVIVELQNNTKFKQLHKTRWSKK